MRGILGALAVTFCLMVLGTSLPADAASVPVVKTDPIKLGTTTVVGANGKAVTAGGTLKALPGAAATVTVPISNVGKVPMKLYLSSLTLADRKKLGAVAKWQVTTTGVTKVSGTLSGGAAQQFTVLKPGKSTKLAIKVQVPTSVTNAYQNASLRFRFVLTEVQTT